MNNLRTLLEKLSVIQMKFETLSKANETFNIFKVLHKEHDERRLHSRFLAALLTPNGSHKMGDEFLSIFLYLIEKNIDLKNAEVYPKESDKTENNNIDILIIDRKSKNAIIIENKINAGDSNNEKGGQLERYYKHVVNTEKIPKKNIWIYYLSLDGHEPSNESLGGEDSELIDKYQCLSYKVHILNWLVNCLEKTASSPFLRESLLQYIYLIRTMTNNISKEERLEIKNLIARSSDNMKSTKLLIDNFIHVKWHTQREFWDELCFRFENLGYVITNKPTNDEITKSAHFESYKKGFKENNNYGIYFEPIKGLQLYVWNSHGYYLSWGAENNNKTSSETKKKIKEYCSGKDSFGKPSEDSLFTKAFDLPDNQQVLIYDFTWDGTFNLIDNEYRNKIIANMVKEIKKFVDILQKPKLS